MKIYRRLDISSRSLNYDGVTIKTVSKRLDRIVKVPLKTYDRFNWITRVDRCLLYHPLPKISANVIQVVTLKKKTDCTRCFKHLPDLSNTLAKTLS